MNTFQIVQKFTACSLFGSLVYNIIYDVHILYKSKFHDLISEKNEFRSVYVINQGFLYGSLFAFFSCYYNKPLRSLIPFLDDCYNRIKM